jgi:hypothetical protein
MKKQKSDIPLPPPPPGPLSREIHVRNRVVELLEAMIRWAEMGLEIPSDWRDELDNHLNDAECWTREDAKRHD